MIVERTSEVITFNGVKLHGLVPKEVADELVELQTDEGPLNQLFEKMVLDSVTSPKMVWDWVALDGQAN